MTAAVTPTPIPDEIVVALRDVSFRRDDRLILEDVSLTVRRGEHWALLGPNGAGKSTILSLCGAVSHPSTGTVSVLDEQLGRVPLEQLRRRIGHVNPRHPLTGGLTVAEVVLTGLTGTIKPPPRWSPSADEVARAEDLLELLGLGGLREQRWPLLSQGERGRTLIARALVASPDLLLLDEPSTGLDLAAREQLLSTIDRLVQTQPGLTSVLVTHHLEELPATTTHAVLLRDGHVTAAGPVAQVLTAERVSQAFAHPIEVESRAGRWSARAASRAVSPDDGRELRVAG